MQNIINRLRVLEKERNITVLYACESGSRAWGIESTDSDYDIRFVYCHNNVDWYLSLNEGTDVINFTEGLLDFSGWDIRKALRLAYKSNPSILEWLYSPIQYILTPSSQLLTVIMQKFSAQALMHHYISLAHRQKKMYWNEDQLKTNNNLVKYKKYLYAIRPILAVLYMNNFQYKMPPIDFTSLHSYIVLPPLVDSQLHSLLAQKKVTTEINGFGRYYDMDQYIDYMIIEGRELAKQAPSDGPNIKDLNYLYREIVLHWDKR